MSRLWPITVYKVVKPVDGGPPISVYARGVLRHQYFKEVWTIAPSKTLPLLAFDTIENARKFIAADDERKTFQVWEAKAIICSSPGGQGSTNVSYYSDYSFQIFDGAFRVVAKWANVASHMAKCRNQKNRSWPAGTVFARKLKLVRLIPNPVTE